MEASRCWTRPPARARPVSVHDSGAGPVLRWCIIPAAWYHEEASPANPPGPRECVMATPELEAPARTGRQASAGAGRPAVTVRLLSLDGYRGFVMLLMVSAGLGMNHLLAANLPPSPVNQTLLVVADQLRHREWHMSFAVNAGFPYWDTTFH